MNKEQELKSEIEKSIRKICLDALNGFFSYYKKGYQEAQELKKKQVEELKKVCFRSLTYDGKKLVEYKEIEEEINKIFNDVTEEKK